MKKLSIIFFLLVVSSFGFERKTMFGMTLLSSRPIEDVWYSAAGMNLTLHTIGGTRLGLYLGYQGLPKYKKQDMDAVIADANDINLLSDTIPGGFRIIKGGFIIALGEHLSIFGGGELVFDCFVTHDNMLENYTEAEYYLEENINKMRFSYEVGGRFFEYVNTAETFGIGFIGGYSFGIQEYFGGIELAWQLGK